MKTKSIIVTIMLVVFSAGTGLAADADPNDVHPYIGVMLDPAPLPDLLVKHLNLAPGQGIRIANIHRGSPADKAGLERDDIIIGFQGKDVDDQQKFIDDVRKAGIGTEVSLQIIHLGKRKTVTLKLEDLKGDFDLKYPPEPQIVQSWRPGKIFRLRPGDKDWMEVFRDNMPSDFDVNIKKFFNELYTYRHVDGDGKEYTVTIEGNPNDEDSTITVQAGEKEFETTIKKIGNLPKKYRDPAQQAVKDARKECEKRKLMNRLDSLRMPNRWRDYFDRFRPDVRPLVPPLEPAGPMFDRIEKQMKELQKRLDNLEKRQDKTLDSEKPDQPERQQQKIPLPLDKENEQRA